MRTPCKSAPRYALSALTLTMVAAGMLYVPSAQAAACATPWAEGTTYAAGTQASYLSNNYSALQTHTAYVGANWNPLASPTLWGLIGACTATGTPAPSPT
ncbi:carbohydrate-binding protein, partial [Chitinimonas sp.]|uniref:carbohydrate-binding protein n=1 Tax=Chitinimonas sp. TaxID=1934313 RepID=UPI002F95DF6B